MISDIFFNRPKVNELTILRRERRRKHRLTYDCMNGIVKGNTVVCKRGHTFPPISNRKEPGIGVLGVIRGISSSVCRECGDYDGEETE